MLKKTLLQAIERTFVDNNWITLVIVFAIVLLAFMKLLRPNKLFGYTISFFNSNFLKKRVEEGIDFFSPFQLLFFLFLSITISLFIILLLPSNNLSFFNFLLLFSFVTFYFLSRFLLDVVFANILGISTIIKYFLFTKTSYLKTLCLLLFPVIIIYEYGFKNKFLLITFFSILFSIRFFLILKHNKKILINKLFYFILYFCTLEMAPLLIVYKITAT